MVVTVVLAVSSKHQRDINFILQKSSENKRPKKTLGARANNILRAHIFPTKYHTKS